ncbi:hypothetical protein BRARA_B01375 [Brassica rapa]|uniref:Uncharacterized protein n=1 Tax=Brassica campestris TaxID=3711 RepID=A0A398ABN0_BRACM|nr:hypothetical protein BRARA_B01375 [Brassica rapa]
MTKMNNGHEIWRNKPYANVQIQQQRKTQSRPPLLWPSSVPLIPNMAAQKDNIVPYRSVEIDAFRQEEKGGWPLIK